jgi:hypothetical protein
MAINKRESIVTAGQPLSRSQAGIYDQPPPIEAALQVKIGRYIVEMAKALIYYFMQLKKILGNLRNILIYIGI